MTIKCPKIIMVCPVLRGKMSDLCAKYIGINKDLQELVLYIHRISHALEKICLLLHVIAFPKWKSVKFLNSHAKDLEE